MTEGDSGGKWYVVTKKGVNGLGAGYGCECALCTCGRINGWEG